MWLASVIVLAYLGLCAWLWLIQRSLIYFPTSAVANPLAEELLLDSHGETLQVWRLSPGNEHAVIYFGGNAEDVSQNSPQLLASLGGRTHYLVNYRGYGGSSGSPTEASLFADALSVFDHVAGQHVSVSVIGRSLGSGVAAYLATSRDVSRLVLATPYDSLARVAQSAYPIFPVALLLRDRYDSVSRAGRIRVPTLIAIAERDEVIPREHAETLAAAFDPSLVEVMVVPGATHNTISGFPVYMRNIAAFLAAQGEAR